MCTRESPCGFAPEKRALNWLLSVVSKKTILEVDCSALKTVLESVDGVRSPIGGLCFDITELGGSFDAFKVCWVSRDANSVAHSCASLGSVSEQAQFWFDYIPEWLLGLSAADCNPVSN